MKHCNRSVPFCSTHVMNGMTVSTTCAWYAINAASALGNERQDFLSEIEMMKKVAVGQNPHVVGLLGCVTIQEPLCLITEFVKYGDLLSYLRTNRKLVC